MAEFMMLDIPDPTGHPSPATQNERTTSMIRLMLAHTFFCVATVLRVPSVGHFPGATNDDDSETEV
jgi:hypothetical protein